MKIRIYCKPSEYVDAVRALRCGFVVDENMISAPHPTGNVAVPGEVAVNVHAEIRREAQP